MHFEGTIICHFTNQQSRGSRSRLTSHSSPYPIENNALQRSPKALSVSHLDRCYPQILTFHIFLISLLFLVVDLLTLSFFLHFRLYKLTCSCASVLLTATSHPSQLFNWGVVAVTELCRSVKYWFGFLWWYHDQVCYESKHWFCGTRPQFVRCVDWASNIVRACTMRDGWSP